MPRDRSRQRETVSRMDFVLRKGLEARCDADICQH